MKLFLLVFAIALGSALAGEVDVTDCGSTAEVKSVEVNPCPPHSPNNGCKLMRGCEVEIKIIFKAANSTDSIKQEVHAELIPRVFVRYRQLPENGACDNCDPTCPIEAAKEVVYKAAFNVLPNYPLINKLNIRWILKDQTNTLVCVKIKAGIGNKPSNGSCSTE